MLQDYTHFLHPFMLFMLVSNGGRESMHAFLGNEKWLHKYVFSFAVFIFQSVSLFDVALCAS